MLLKQSTARNRVVLMIDDADHITGKTGLTLTITASKNGAAFGSISPTVTELADGWYSLALTTSHTDTLGDLALHITSTGADPTDTVDQVVVDLPGATVSSVTGNVVVT
jgi:phage tail sheath gpL-like